MVGIVTVDDAMDVLQEETTEDISIMAGVNLMKILFWNNGYGARQKQASLAFVSDALGNSDPDDHEQLRGCAGGHAPTCRFIPMLTGTGGNCGSQSSTLVIRGIAVGEIEFKDIFRVIFKEVRIALCSQFDSGDGQWASHLYYVRSGCDAAVAIGITMIAVVVMAKTIGCVCSGARDRLDPAIIGGTFDHTILDTCTILVYFRIVTAFFHI